MVFASHGITFFQHPAFQTLLILPAAGPTLAAIIVQTALVGKTKINAWFRSLWRWKAEIRWLVIAVALPAIIFLLDKFVAQAFKLLASAEVTSEKTAGIVLGAFVIALGSNPWEEVGWRGFALPLNR